MPGCSLTSCRICASRSPGRATLRRRAAVLADGWRAGGAAEPVLLALTPEPPAFAFLLAARRRRGLAAALRAHDPVPVAFALARLAPVFLRDVALPAAAADPDAADPGVYSSSR